MFDTPSPSRTRAHGLLAQLIEKVGQETKVRALKGQRGVRLDSLVSGRYTGIARLVAIAIIGCATRGYEFLACGFVKDPYKVGVRWDAEALDVG